MRSSPAPHDPRVLALTEVLELSGLLLASRKVRLRIASRSMVPTLRPGDQIVVQPVSPKELRPGDLILFEHQGRLICHRLVEIVGHSPTCLTQGEAASGGGERIDHDQVLGKVVAVRTWGLWLRLTDRLRRVCEPWLLRWLPTLQRLRAYRLVLRPFLVPFVTYELGLAQGSRWYCWQELRNLDSLPALPSGARSHLLLARAGKAVAGWMHLTRSGTRWHCEDLFVRIRYRGLGLESDLSYMAGLLFGAQRTTDA